MALCPGCLTDVFAAQVDGLFQIRQSLVGLAQVAVDGGDTVVTPGIARVCGDDVLEIRQGLIVLAVYFIGQGQVVERSDVFGAIFNAFSMSSMPWATSFLLPVLLPRMARVTPLLLKAW
mgnify:CR=1 FL=1